MAFQHLDSCSETPSDSPDAVLIAPSRLDVNNYQVYMWEIRKLLEDGAKSISIDLSELGFMDTYGLSVLVKGCKLASAKGVDFCVIKVRHEAIRIIFQVTKIERILSVQYD